MTTQYAPCHNVAVFHGVASVVFNDELGELLVQAIRPSNEPILLAIADEIDGKTIEDTPESHDVPSFDYSYFLGKNTLTLNKPAASLLESAIYASGNGGQIHAALWSLRAKLASFADFKRDFAKAA